MLISNFQEYLGLRRLQYWHFSKSGWVFLGQDLSSIIWLEKEVLSFVRGDDKLRATCFNDYNNVLLSMNAVPWSIGFQPLLKLNWSIKRIGYH